ncbi:MAG TPA: hypothetical protein QF604_21560, partial [Candidatus Latescibacteria bacterium]|nr:hypothetical protein [Candidatus Latescibacterota bacterium]
QFSSWPQLQRSVQEIESVEARVDDLSKQFAGADTAGRQRLLEPVHDRKRFVDYSDGDTELSAPDARLVIANSEGYALWSKYESYVRLDPVVRDLIVAIREGEHDTVRSILAKTPEVANPRWVAGFEPNWAGDSPGTPNDSIPLFDVSEAVFNGTNRKGNEGEIAADLLAAGADPNLDGQPLEEAVSFNCPRVVESLIAGGVDSEAPAPGVMLAYPMLFGFTECCEMLANAGARLDLRFAAGLGRIDVMETFVGPAGLLPDQGLADPYTRSVVARGEPSVRAERTDDVVLGQALLYACLHGRLEAAEWLLAHGARADALVRGTDVDSTVLHRLAGPSFGETRDKTDVEQERLPIVEWVLAHGGDPTVPDAMHNAPATSWVRHAGLDQIAALMESHEP